MDAGRFLMDAQPDRPFHLPCAFCGASVPISWEYYPLVDVWLGTGEVCCGFVIESYQSDSGLPFELLELLGAGAGAGAGDLLGACDRKSPAAKRLFSAPLP
jgi:hypothetical protein